MVTLSAEETSSLRELCQRRGVTSFMMLLAAFKVLLWRSSGQTDLVIGTPISGRSHRKVEGLIGFFVNNLVLRTDLAGDPTFPELWSVSGRSYSVRSRGRTCRSRNWSRSCGPSGTSAAIHCSRFCSTTSNWTQKGNESRLGPVQVQMLGSDLDFATIRPFDPLHRVPRARRDPDRVRARSVRWETVKRLLGHYRYLLLQIGQSEDRPISRLQLMDESRSPTGSRRNGIARSATCLPLAACRNCFRTGLGRVRTRRRLRSRAAL